MLKKLAQMRHGRVLAWLFQSPLQLFLCLSVLVAVSEAVMLQIGRRVIHEAGSTAVEQQSLAFVRVMARVVDEHMNALRGYVELSAHRRILVEPAATGDFVAVEATLRQLLDGNKHFYRVFFADPTGTVKAVYPPDHSVVDRNFSYRDWYKTIISVQKTIVSNFQKTPVPPHTLVTAIATPVHDGAGKVIGYLVCQVKVSDLAKWVSDHRPNPTSAVLLLDRAGNSAMSTDIEAPLANFGQDAAVKSVLAQPEHLLTAGSPLDKAPSLISSSPLSEVGWSVVVVQPVAEAYRAETQLLHALTALGVIFGLIALGCSYVWLNTLRLFTTEQAAAQRTVDESQRRMRAALAEAVERGQQLTKLAETVPQIIWTADGGGQFDYYNQKWFDVTGLTFEQCKGVGWVAGVHPDDRPECQRLWQASLATGADFEVIFRLFDRSTTDYRWYVGRACALHSDEGKVIKWFGSCSDIHDQRQTLLELAVSERRLSTVVANAPIVLWAVDEHFRFTFSDGRGLAALGLRPGEVVGRSARIMYKDSPQILLAIDASLRGAAVTEETQVGALYFESHYAPMLDAAGKVCGVVGISTDITAKKQLQLAYEQTRADLEKSQQSVRRLTELVGKQVVD